MKETTNRTASDAVAPDGAAGPLRPPDADSRSRAALIETLGRALQGRSEVRLVMLFGSRARGRPGPGSDVDLAVEAPAVDLWTLAADLSQAVGLEVDVVDLREAGYPLLKAVLRDGRLVHQGQRGALGSWRSQAIARIELDRPWFERMRDAFLRKLAEGHG